MDRFIEEFLMSLREHGRAKNTEKKYVFALKRFFKFLGTIFSETASPNDISLDYMTPEQYENLAKAS